MTMRTLGYTCATLAAVALSAVLTGVAAADHHKEGDKKAAEKGDKAKASDPQAMMAAYEKAGEPVEQHKHLMKMVGKWNLSLKSWMDPKAPPMETKGTAETKALLGDRFVQTTVTSDMMGKPFTGIGISGYDKTKKKFVGTWIDSMSTGVMTSEGTSDAAGKVLTSNMVGTDAVTGKPSRMRIVSKWETDDKIVEEFYEKKGGKEVKMMEITYTRAK